MMMKLIHCGYFITHTDFTPQRHFRANTSQTTTKREIRPENNTA
jgi:hypothetical protein